MDVFQSPLRRKWWKSINMRYSTCRRGRNMARTSHHLATCISQSQLIISKNESVKRTRKRRLESAHEYIVCVCLRVNLSQRAWEEVVFSVMRPWWWLAAPRRCSHSDSQVVVDYLFLYFSAVEQHRWQTEALTDWTDSKSPWDWIPAESKCENVTRATFTWHFIFHSRLCITSFSLQLS